MDLIKKFSDIIPNPLSNKSNLPDLEKKMQLINSSLSLQPILVYLLVLLIFTYFLNSYFKIATTIINSLIAIEFIIISVKGYLIIEYIKLIKNINSQDAGFAYRDILVANEKFKTIQSGLSFLIFIIAIGLLFFLFDSGVIKSDSFFIINSLTNFWTEKLFILFVLIVKFVSFLNFLIRYNFVRKITGNSDFAQVNKDYNLILEKINIIGAYIFLGIVLLIYALFLFNGMFGLPSDVMQYVFIFMILIAFLTLYFRRVGYRRLQSVDFVNESKISVTDNINLTKKFTDEEIIGSVFGISRAMTRFKDMFKSETRVSSSSFLGVGKSSCPENTIIITNHRLLFVQLPLPGGDNVIGDIDYVGRNFLFNRSEMIEKGERLIKEGSFDKILELTKYDILYKDIKSVLLYKRVIKININDGRRLGYFFLDKQYNLLFNQLLPRYLGDKIINK